MKTLAPYLALFPLVFAPSPAVSQENPFRIGELPAPTELVFGRKAQIQLPTGKLEGELLSVSTDSLWILSRGTILGMPLGDVRGVDVQMHKWGKGRMLKWNLLAGLGSAVALTVACGSVDDVGGGCGTFALSWVLSWGLVGGISGAALAASSHREVHPSRDALRPYVRFPQGLPNGGNPGLGPRIPGG